MQIVYFLYGLAFIVLASVVFMMPKRNDCLDLGNDIIFAGLFGLTHGLNEWVELLILRGEPFDVNTLTKIWYLLLPLSFTFLVMFGVRVIARILAKLKWIKYAWLFFPVLWFFFSLYIRDSVASGISARYLLCFPGSLLTAAAIYIKIGTCDYRQTPKSMFYGAYVASAAFLFYALFSGLITPKAGFLPASIVNYDNFARTFHLPVQILRMICAFLATVGFVMITGTFYRERGAKRLRGTVKRKLTLVIVGSAVFITFAGVGLASFAGSNLLAGILGREYIQITDSLSIYIKKALDDEIEDAMSYTTRPLWKDIINEKNASYASMDNKVIQGRMSMMDEKWPSLKEGDPVFKEYLENRVSIGMREIIKLRGTISELFITDKYGGIVSASSKTSDFYQADEEWWIKAYNEGRGAVYVGGIEFDELSGGWAVAIAVPFKDSNGEVIGICKSVVLISRLFGSLAGFRIGDTGYAILTDEKGRMIFNRAVTDMTEPLYTEEEMKNILNKKEHYFIAKDDRLHHKKIFAAFTSIKPSYFSRDGALWVVFMVQDAAETLRPLSKFIEQLIIITIFMMVLMIPVASVFGIFIVNSVHELHLAMEHIMAGDWDYPIDIRTGDEIEDFADAFKHMTANIKMKQGELESFSAGLEEKVKARTQELAAAQEAALNIMEDLQTAKEDLERTNRELMKLDQLKSDFISTVSHELRTPLSIIKEGISLVIDRIPGDINEKQQKILDISKFNIDRLARIIDSLLEISKIEAGKAELKRSLINISDIVNQVASSFEGKARDKGLKLQLDLDRMSASVYADPDKIIQVLTNLIGNAVKFTQSGYVKVSCLCRHRQACPCLLN